MNRLIKRKQSQLYRHYGNSVRLISYVLIFLLGTLFSSPALSDDHKASPEYKLKAALLYKLTKFVEWPAALVSNAEESFNLCILGDNVFAEALEPLTQRKVREQAIKLHFFNRSNRINQHCHLLFITDSKRAFLGNILSNINKVGCLTISDINNFAEDGGVIELTRGEKKIGFKINLEEAKLANLSLAAPLLELSTVINNPNEEAQK
ncbi:MAG: YfiR family protein [Gammaproteobacteria bacterium]|nr:YfiR family protein [Gammaproteobacteria bacterium]